MNQINNILEQLKNMTEDERKDFVEAFNAMEVKQDPTELPELVVCAAVIGFIGLDKLEVIGLRHYDPFMRLQIKMLEENTKYKFNEAEQGFITNKGRFVSRQEALKIAQANNQMRRYSSGKNPNMLFSEDLY